MVVHTEPQQIYATENISQQLAAAHSDVLIWLGLVLRAWVWLLKAWTSRNYRSGQMQGLEPGLGLAWAEPGLSYEKCMQSNIKNTLVTLITTVKFSFQNT